MDIGGGRTRLENELYYAIYLTRKHKYKNLRKSCEWYKKKHFLFFL